jgi:prepilin-type N-terminal cleavage/methylation domain-containing protein
MPRRVPAPGASHSDARGFTLVELIVAMVLLAIALTMVTRGLLDGFSSTSDAITEREAQHMVDKATQQLTQDLRSARANDRNVNDIRQPYLLTRAIMLGTAIYSGDCPPSATCKLLDVADVKAATSTTFEFMADVDTSSVGAECVTYTIPPSGATFWMRRAVTAYSSATRTCAAAGASGAYLIRPQKVPTSAVGHPVFSYQLVCNRSAAGCSLAGGPKCTPTTQTSVGSAVARNWITSVTVDLTSLVERGESRSIDSLKGTASIRTRENHDYRLALGCIT